MNKEILETTEEIKEEVTETESVIKEDKMAKEKVNPIILTMEDGTEYTLEFSRKTVEWAERRGFTMDDLSEHLMVRLPELFHFAFRMHHPRITKEQADRILFDDIGGITEEMVTRLGQLYMAGYDSLVNEDAGKNSKVTITM